MDIGSLVWDEWNITHIARHGVTVDEVDEVCEDKPATSKTYAGRIRVIGSTASGKVLTVILAPKGQDSFYVVTARPASRKELLRYAPEQGEGSP